MILNPAVYTGRAPESRGGDLGRVRSSPRQGWLCVLPTEELTPKLQVLCGAMRLSNTLTHPRADTEASECQRKLNVCVRNKGAQFSLYKEDSFVPVDGQLEASVPTTL